MSENPNKLADEIDEKIYEYDLRIILNEMLEVDVDLRIKFGELKLKLESTE